MCLGIPGKIVEVSGEQPLERMGKVSFSGVLKDVYLAGVPGAEVGDFVIVHAGFALSVLNESEADEVFDYLRQIAEFGAKELSDE